MFLNDFIDVGKNNQKNSFFFIFTEERNEIGKKNLIHFERIIFTSSILYIFLI